MDYPKLIVSNQKEDSIRIQRVKSITKPILRLTEFECESLGIDEEMQGLNVANCT